MLCAISALPARVRGRIERGKKVILKTIALRRFAGAGRADQVVQKSASDQVISGIAKSCSIFCFLLIAIVLSFAQGPMVYELACPHGYSPLPTLGKTFDQTTGQWRANICVSDGSDGRMVCQMDGCGSGGGFPGNVNITAALPLVVTPSPIVNAGNATINTCGGDSGSGGSRGVVPAPVAGDFAAKKILGANCAWDTPASLGIVPQVNSDWNAVSGVAEILNKPTIPAAQVNSDWNAVSGVAEILNKPTIPAAQVNSDWNAVSGVAEILNKPTIPAGQVQSDWTEANSGLPDFILHKPGDFVGDSGSGGVHGFVPAPAAGDAAANKVLGAGGGWVTPMSSSNLQGPFLLMNPQPDATGNVFWQVAALTNFRGGHWEWAYTSAFGGTDDLLYFTLKLPHVIPAGAAKLILDTLSSSDATAGHTMTFKTCDVLVTTTYNVGALSCTATQDFTTASTAYSPVTLTFALNSTPIADALLVVAVHATAKLNITANVLMNGVYLEWQ